jgi:hypothetical protein
MVSAIPWASVVGSGLAGALIAYPLMYLALANRYKAKLSNFANFCLFVVAVPLIGIADVMFGGSSKSLTGILVLFGSPLLVCFIVIGAAFESRADRVQAPPKASLEVSLKGGLHRFSRPAERVGLIAMVLGLSLLFVGLIGYWAHRGFYLDQLKYDLAEILLDDIHYRRGWSQWFARIGLVLSLTAFAVAFQYERTVSPVSRLAASFVRWVRTGQ